MCPDLYFVDVCHQLLVQGARRDVVAGAALGGLYETPTSIRIAALRAVAMPQEGTPSSGPQCGPLERVRAILTQTGANLCFFFQAEDGIRDLTVTGVQTCALPI